MGVPTMTKNKRHIHLPFHHVLINEKTPRILTQDSSSSSDETSIYKEGEGEEETEEEGEEEEETEEEGEEEEKEEKKPRCLPLTIEEERAMELARLEELKPRIRNHKRINGGNQKTAT